MLGEGIGDRYVDEQCPPEAKEEITTLVVAPDAWKTDEAVAIGDSCYASFVSAANAETRYQLSTAGQPVDRND